jgi:serine/threonine protein kinase
MALEVSSEEDRLTEKCGSKEYWSPERCLGDYGMKADIYALGVVVFCLLVGRFPFATKRQTLDMERRPTIPKIVDSSTRSFLENALEKIESRRDTAVTLRQHPWLSSVDENDLQLLHTESMTSFIKRAAFVKSMPLAEKCKRIDGKVGGKEHVATSHPLDSHAASKETADRLFNQSCDCSVEYVTKHRPGILDALYKNEVGAMLITEPGICVL